MLVLSKHSTGNPETDALAECVMLLVKAIERHLVIVDEKDAEEFRAGLCRLEDGLHESVETRVRVDAVVKLLTNYATRTNQVIGRQRAELSQLTSDLSAGSIGLQGAVERLRACQEHIDGERSLGSPSVYATDPLTGLPGRAYAQNELARTHAQHPDCLIAFFVVKRLSLINAKFGFSRGDQVLLKVVQSLAQMMPDYNNLCRWSPCSFLIITSPLVTPAELRGHVHDIELLRMTPTLEWEGHSALVPIAMDCRAMSLREFGSPDLLFRKLDGIASNT